MKKIKVAQIGTSAYSHGNFIWESMLKQKDIFDVVGYAFPENERDKFPEQAKAFDGYREMTVDEILNDSEIEAVAIETEEIYLTKYALMAANAGKNMHMEKPGGRELCDFEKLISVMKKTGKVFHTGYMYRYNPYIKELLAQIKNGELGDIISVEAHMNCIHPAKTRQWLEVLPGGMTFFLGCHLIDLIYAIQGKPKNIIPLNKCSKVDGVTAEDFGMAVFEYENGVSFAKTSAVEIGGFERRQLVVSGTKKTVELKPLEWYVNDGSPAEKCLITERYVRESIDWEAETKKERSTPCNRYDSMMESFAEMVRGEKQNPWSYDYELELYKVVLEACGGKKYV